MADSTNHQYAGEQSVRDGSFVDWGCVSAGAVVAAAVSLVLYTFGSGLGLSLVSPWSGAGTSMLITAIIVSIWAVAVQVGAFAAGGYLAGRMRRPWRDAKTGEIEFRDGVHGALAWAVGALFSALLVAWTAGGAARAVSDVGAASVSGMANSDAVTSTAVDTLFRSQKPQDPAGGGADFRAEAGRILASAVGRGELTAADRTYLAQLVAARTGLGQAEAEQRIDQVVATAKSATDRARKIGIVTAFLTAASLLAGCAAAWSAARLGGSHRDEGTIWRGLERGGWRSPASKPQT